MKRALFALLLAAAVTAHAAPTHYSKLGIVTAARKLGRLDAMNNWIQQAGYWNEWLACQVFRDDYPGFADISNAVVASGLATSAEVSAVLEAARVESETDRLRAMVESDKGLREKYHGGRIGQYILTNETGRIIRVDLYADATVWTNGYTYGVSPLLDPEAQAKAIAEAAARKAEERERVQAAWEAANLPPDLAALRARQREAARQAKEAED
jgi:hypothetical protein